MRAKQEQIKLDILEELPVRRKGIIIPKDIYSLDELDAKLNGSLFSEDYKLKRFKCMQFINAIKSYHDCSYVRAQELLVEHRDNGQPIKIDFKYFF